MSSTDTYRIVRYGEIDVCWSFALEGGGRTFGQSFLPVIAHLFGRVDRLFELCAGSGCIGFSLLANGHCDSLVLSDTNPVAVAAMRETVRRNGLEDRVTLYESDGLTDIPAEESCDLFIANPPFFNGERIPILRENPWMSASTELRVQDRGWKLHRHLYANMSRFLRPGGSSLFQETSLGVPPEEFLPMVEEGGMRHVSTVWCNENRRIPGIYFLWTKPASTTVLVNPPDAAPAQIELSDTAGEPVELSTGEIHRLRLHNTTGRPVSPRVDLTGGSDGRIERPLTEIPPGGELELPPTAIGAGKRIVFREEPGGKTLAEATGSEGEAAPRRPAVTE